MAKYGLLFLVAFVLAVTFQEGDALRCWKCSSDASNGAYCNDPFDPSILTDQQYQWTYTECTLPPSQLFPYNSGGGRFIPVCKKQRQRVNNKVSISRSCGWELESNPPKTCTPTEHVAYVQVEYCETCYTDGCNGASQFGPIAMLVAIPALIAKVLAW